LIAGGYIAGVVIFNPGSGHQREVRDSDRWQEDGVLRWGLSPIAQINGLTFLTGSWAGHKKFAFVN
jgi:hypothetical protein